MFDEHKVSGHRTGTVYNLGLHGYGCLTTETDVGLQLSQISSYLGGCLFGSFVVG